MKFTGSLKWIVLGLFLFLFQQSQAATLYQAGSTVAEFSAHDQHGKAFTFKPGIRFLLVSFDMATARSANRKLSELGATFLPQHSAAFVSNVQGIPRIGRSFAMSKMRKYNHRIILAEKDGLLAPFPKKESFVTVLVLDPEAHVKEVTYWNPETTPAETLLVIK